MERTESIIHTDAPTPLKFDERIKPHPDQSALRANDIFHRCHSGASLFSSLGNVFVFIYKLAQRLSLPEQHKGMNIIITLLLQKDSTNGIRQTTFNHEEPTSTLDSFPTGSH